MIKRYDVEINGWESGVDVIEIDDGAWVKYDDVKHLIKQESARKQDEAFRVHLQRLADERSERYD